MNLGLLALCVGLAAVVPTTKQRKPHDADGRQTVALPGEHD